MECRNEMLTRAMATAGARNGFDDVKAEFSAFRDFKLKWTRTSKWISFEVSDYLRNAPESVIRSLAETVFARIGGEDGKEYSEEVCEYLSSQGFLRDNQELFLKRIRGISQTTCGENVDLAEAYGRLINKGIVERDPNLVIRWRSESSSKAIVHSSILMKTIIINQKLDIEDISENTLDYALYTQICRVNLGFNETQKNNAKKYELIIAKFPEREKAINELIELGIIL